MKARFVFLAVMVLFQLMAFGRLLQIQNLKELIADSRLVFVGRVKSIEPSDIRTSLSYPPYDGTTFQWLISEVEVLEPFKGVQKGALVHVAMLSIDKQSRSQPSYSPPGMLEPEKGDVFFLCLGATPHTNVFAALLGPYDENLSVFTLRRTPSLRSDDPDFINDSVLKKDRRFDQIWNLVDKAGEINPANTDRLRETFAAEIWKSPSTNVIYLQWETYTNAHGWMSDVPKGFTINTNTSGK